MNTGTVKWFDAQRGFGFIQPEDGSEDIIVRKSAVQQAGLVELRGGQKLSFVMMVERRSGKMSAEELRPA
jgi:CspA family cold shock protein